MSFDVAAVRRQFPILSQIIDGQPVHYLDNGASAQTPEAVLDAVRTYETTSRANVLRGVHRLAERATEAYENARVEVADFLSVDPMEVVFTGGCTAAINLVAYSYGSLLKPGDRIILSELEHHSNIVPWQLLRQRSGIEIDVVPVTVNGRIDLNALPRLLTPAHQADLARPCLQRHRHLGRRPRRGDLGQNGRRQGDARRRPARAARAARPAGHGHRFLCLRRPQGLWAERHRRAVGQGRASGSHAAVPWRRLDDRPRHLRRDDLGAAAAPLRGRHAADRSGDRPGRRLQVDARARLDGSARARDGAGRAADGWPAEDRRRDPVRARPARRTAIPCCRSCSRASIRTTWRRPSIRSASRCAPATTAASR